MEYEVLHLLCKKCGIFGHVARNFPAASGEATGDQLSKTAGVEWTPAVGDKALAAEGANKPEAVKTGNPNEASTSPVIGGKEDLYGDWLVINKGRRQSANRGGQRSGGNKDGREHVRDPRRATTLDNKFQTLASNHVGAHHAGDTRPHNFVQGVSPIPNEATRDWKKKKRTRRDPPPLKKNIAMDGGHIPFGPETSRIILARQGGDKPKSRNNDIPRQGPIMGDNDQLPPKQVTYSHAFGIQTAMNVEAVASNHMHFLDEPDPPDDELRGTRNRDAKLDPAIDHEMESIETDSEVEVIIVETPAPA